MKAIGYIRVSTTNQDILRQTEKFKDYCTTTGYTNVDVIVDFGISGSTFEREGYKKLQQVTKDAADIIVISELSRLSRKEDILDTLNSVQNITSKGLKLVFLDDINRIYTGTLDLQEIIILTVGAYGAAQERLSIKRRNQEGKKVLFESNPYAVVDGKIPYGFDKVVNPNGTHPKFLLQVNEREARNVNTIFNLIINDYSVAKAAKYLFDTGVKNRDNEVFSKQYLSKLISNPIYKGDRKRKNNPNTKSIEAIVIPDVWETVQVKVKENYLYNSSGTTMFNPLRGIIKCRCGRAMMIKNKGNNVLVYRCSDVQPKYLSNKCKHIDSIRFDLTNEVIFSLLQKIDFVEVTGNVQDKINDFNSQINGISSQLLGHRTQITNINAELELLQERYISARSQSLADRVQNAIISQEEEIKKVEKVIIKKTRAIEALKNQIISLREVSKTDDFNNLDIKERAKLFKKYIKRIQYLPVTIMQGFYRIEFTINHTAVIAVKKTTHNPIFSVVPNGLILNDDTTLTVTNGFSNNSDPYNFNNYRTEKITIQQYFKAYATDKLDVNLSYRDKITY